ncbi:MULTISPECIES: DNA polymerase I [Halomonadaceae]|jgi:DNA polymerase I|uniref:DNA polymerase I n=1 Tax=Halomonadaceae TaxID=28256 RepID=UPI0012F0807E|nr:MULTISPECIES: DNA polymerase I [Halomonas]CAD5255934.1 fused DNA polymerase I 5'->3' exonuclease; 3'->5' polymerase; 3'->5' exonuclease [Halomonas sp. 59]CAD5256514.1 fused DNA polymerase I 5'->3' exonuclease; 3'->5' polymerase; 3'->5' exonuclease [Halomonas sp. 113]CAD5263003.1 fused DNA polymerase I 5'->3' exonuclease; 3'->5' polymerase; 3'->5' exonuclease [Halomonas sp. I3]CAD5292762.1 fused DNA polymerase I 5'->3' exonuclease; 3'->5' polymerase; 3'->5' exonuclease [Halomonas sp. 156]VXB
MARAPIVLVDGSSYLYRAFHALPPLTTSNGQPTGAVKGVLNMLKRLIKDYPESPMAVVFDAPGKTFRDELYSDYKAHRPPMPDDLRSQIAPLHACVKALGLPLLCVDGVEADDVIGTLAHHATQAGRDAVISTGDKDMAQLVNAHITLVNTMKDETLDEAGVEEKFGLPPALIIDFLALMGDKVDNIPGVPGVGEKTAIGLLQGMGGGLETIYGDLERVKTLTFRGAKTLPKKLEEHRDQAFLSYQLATIKVDCELPVGLDDLDIAHPDREALVTLYKEMEFRQWLGELLEGKDEGVDDVKGGEPAPVSAEEGGSESEGESTSVQASVREDQVILEQADFERWLDRLQNAERFCFDLETTSLNYMDAEIVGVGLSLEVGEAAYIPLAHDYLDAPKQLDRKTVLAALKPLLEDPTKTKIGQNLKYDISVLANYAISVAGPFADTMLASYVLNSTATRHDMDSLALKYLGEKTISFEEIAGKGAKQLTFNQIALEQAAPYACEDVDITLRLQQALRPQVESEGRLAEVLDNIELPLIKVLSRIERNGVAVDAELLHKQSQQLEQRIGELEREAFELAGREFNLGSPKQLGQILFEEQKIPVLKKTPKGAPSTAEGVLEELALDYPLPKVIMQHRGLAKLKSTYTDKLPRLLNKATGRVHTSYHQAVTATGRLSSSDPNLQNIPIRTEEGRKIRQAFIARPGYRIVAADYSQIELRIMAHLSEDKGLLEAFAEGRDIHTATAAEVFGTSLEKVSGDQRRSAKAINFGLIYGMSAWGLSRQLHIERNQAQTYIDRYFDRYPGVARYMERIRSQAAEDGFVETVLGRRLYLPEIQSQNRNRRQGAERTAINAPMQGTAADIIKQAMINVDAWLAEGEFDALMVMQVHDELVFEVAEKQVEAFIEQVQKRMQGAAELKVPLIVEAESGANWDEAH